MRLLTPLIHESVYEYARISGKPSYIVASSIGELKTLFASSWLVSLPTVSFEEMIPEIKAHIFLFLEQQHGVFKKPSEVYRGFFDDYLVFVIED
jgi:hypothetical protein